MATITLRLSAKTDKATSQHELLMRFRHGKLDQYAKTNVFVHPDYWNNETQSIVVPNWRILPADRKQLKAELQNNSDRLNQIISLVQSEFQALDKNHVAKDWLKSVIDGFNFPKAEVSAEEQQASIFDEFTTFIETRNLSPHRKRQYQSVWRTLKRFDMFKNANLTFESITADTLRDFEKFLINEHKFVEQKRYLKIFAEVEESRLPKQRGKNSINGTMKMVKAFTRWAIEQGKTTNNPFGKYKISECVYGTPYYITIDERNQLYNHDFGEDARLARQRDIFVFQCLIGCRVSDLWAMTKSNIVNGAIEYIPRKTKEGRPVTVRVPLNSIAKEIIERYKNLNGTELLPFTSQQHYNRDIKTMFKSAGLTRVVTVINPTTREEEQRPICDIASSHLARRCFVGNLYKQVKDPNLIGKLSGHKEGSRAFARYREIDEETSRELVKMLE